MKKLFLLLLVLLSYNCYAQFGSAEKISDLLFDVIRAKPYDLDNDGDLDVVAITNNTNSHLVWYENLGGGTFGKKNTISTGINKGKDIEAGDLDNDGDLDILSVSQNDSTVAWYENLGGGVFGNPQLITNKVYGAITISIADLDGDLDLDVVTGAFNGNEIAWFENLGNGVIDTTKHVITTSLNRVQKVHSADMDNDGDIDVLSASGYDNKITWFENFGGGVFSTQKIISSSAIFAGDVITVDVDNDLDNDVITMSNYKIAWHENLGGGIIDTIPNIITQLPSSYGMGSIDVGDANNDGNIDVFFATYSGGGFNYGWYQNMGGGIIDTTVNVISDNFNSATYITVDDLDNDGDIDALVVDSQEDNISYFENTGMASGVFKLKEGIASHVYDIRSVKTADLNGDGYEDIVATGNWDNKVSWYINKGNNTFSAEQVINDSLWDAVGLHPVDIDNDGDIDLLVLARFGGKIVLFENINNGFGPQKIIKTAAYNDLWFINSVDLDNDGLEDIFFPLFDSNKLMWLKNLGGGIIDTVEQIIDSNFVTGHSIVPIPSDIDNDGDYDLITADTSSVIWYENYGNGTFSSRNQIHKIITSFGYIGSVYCSDLDGDGNKDVVAAWGQKNVAWFKNIGSGVFDTTRYILNSGSSGSNESKLLIGDIDGDGDNDVIHSAQAIEMFENLNNSGFSMPVRIFTPVSPQLGDLTSLADLDNDGDFDIATGIYWDDNVRTIENYFANPRIKGVTFYDTNQDGVLDTNDYGLAFNVVQIQPAGVISNSDSLGNYFFVARLGAHTVSYAPNSLWNLTSDSASYTLNLSTSNQIIDSLNFGFYPDTITTKIHPDLTGYLPRCNNIVNYWINIQNQGTTVPNGVIHLQLDDSISFISTTVTPDSINGQNIYWHYDSLFFFSSEMINLQVQMPPFTSMGDTLTSYLTVNELDTFNNIVYTNIDTLEQILVCAYDPNDKSVTPKGVGIDGFIPQNQELEYLIRFQNTGNDTAITVMIRDQLDENLDWSTLQPIASSHNMQVWIEQDGKAVFKFVNIMLPDSNVDFLGSQGFVKFSIQPDTGLAPLTPIYNTANIYFDYNPAVITNAVLNTIECYSAPQPVVSYNFPYLESGVTGNYTYQWYLNDTLIAGATNDTLMPLVDGNYTVQVTDSNGCYKISTPYNHISVGIEETQQLHTVVFPNPFNESTTILFNKNFNGEYDLLVYNIIGAEAKRINKITGNKIIINKKDIGKGMFLAYLIHNKTGKRVFIEKLIVQ